MYIFIYIQGSVIKLNLYSFLNSPSFLKKKHLGIDRIGTKSETSFFFRFHKFCMYANCITSKVHIYLK